MCLSLCDYQPKASRYSNRLTYLKKSNHKSKRYNRFTEIKKKNHKHNTKENHQTTKGKTKKKGTKKKHKINWKTGFKMAINTYLSTIILNVNGQNALIKRHRVANWVKNKSLQYSNTRDPL